MTYTISKKRAASGFSYVPTSGAAVSPTIEALQAMPAAHAMPPSEDTRVRLNADILFDIDGSTLRPAGEAALNEFVVSTMKLDPGIITAIGYAERLGANADDQRLSEQRAASVKAYLANHGLDADHIQMAGVSRT